MPLIDTHYHLDKYRNHRNIYQQINKLKQYTLCVTGSPGVFLSCKQMYSETKYLRFALGVHPLEIEDPHKAIFEFEHCLPNTQYIGEVGLDYTQNIDSRNAQIQVFEHIMSLQAKLNLPASIHIRSAEDDAYRIMLRYPNPKRIIHWFTGTEEQLDSLLSLGCYFSINSSMINSEKHIQKLRQIPLERILIESDGPYTRVDGKVFSPEHLGSVYNHISTLMKISNIEEHVYQNFRCLLQQ